jgi:hypothetical protein
MLPVVALVQAPAGETAIRTDYIRALGGAEALQAVTSRITEGRFNNGRGLEEAFRLYEKAPNKRLTTIGRESMTSPRGSGRGYDGVTGWDKNFIGTGLRTLQDRELADLARDADFFAALHLFEACSTISVDSPNDKERRVLCRLTDGRSEEYTFSSRGLLSRKNLELPDGYGTVSLRFEDYRQVDAILVPFRTTVVLPDGNVVTYVSERVRHNAPIDDAVFVRPAR